MMVASRLSEESVKKILKDLGLTVKEAEVYIYLAKNGASKGGEISKRTKTQKTVIYRILKSLENKNLIELTLEFPARFTAVPFETILDLNIKNKREEATQIEKQKEELLTYLKKLKQVDTEVSIEKFTVIEGNRRIYSKILQLIQEAKNKISIALPFKGLMHADQFGVLDPLFDDSVRSNIQICFLTDFSLENLAGMKVLLKRKAGDNLNFKGRNPDLAPEMSPRMIIRDDQELLFFITPKNIVHAETNDVCLWTNCKALVNSFTTIFEDLWINSSEIKIK